MMLASVPQRAAYGDLIIPVVVVVREDSGKAPWMGTQ